MFNIRSVDLNLLPVFEAVYEEQSLSRAAVRLAMTQSAVSHALTRLRALFGDELFVRRPRGVVPTPTADAIYAKLHDALGSMRETVAERRGFVARTSKRRYFLAIAHPLGPMIVLRLLERLADGRRRISALPPARDPGPSTWIARCVMAGSMRRSTGSSLTAISSSPRCCSKMCWWRWRARVTRRCAGRRR